MRARASVIAAILLLVFVLCSYRGKSTDTVEKGIGEGQPQAEQPAQAIYASDPDHIWNRLFRLFYVRHARDGHQYGGDELDPYLWLQTRYLLSGSSNDEARRLLDQFLEQHSERLVTNPLKRALFQRDLLAVYDWLSSPLISQRPGCTELQKRVAEIIRRLALSEDEIRKLPDNYDDAIRAQLFPTTYDSRVVCGGVQNIQRRDSMRALGNWAPARDIFNVSYSDERNPLLFVISVLASVLPVVSQQTADVSAELQYVVILSRHGVRAPTSAAERLN